MLLRESGAGLALFTVTNKGNPCLLVHRLQLQQTCEAAQKLRSVSGMETLQAT